MQLFLLFSMPLFLGHIISRHREELDDLVSVRKRVVSGLLWSALAVLILFILSLNFKVRIAVLPLYLYNLLMFYTLPLIFSFGFAWKLMDSFRSEGERGLLLLRSQLTGYFMGYNVGAYFVFIGSLDQMILLALPLFYLLFVLVISRAMWRSARFEAQWKALMVLMLGLLFLALPLVQVLYGLVRELWAWLLAFGLAVLIGLSDWFFTRLEGDIQYRLGLESRFKPLIRLFFRPRS